MATSVAIKVHVSKTYELSDAAQAHRDLESRQTTGKLLIEVRSRT